jgi:hypothetical protein
MLKGYFIILVFPSELVTVFNGLIGNFYNMDEESMKVLICRDFVNFGSSAKSSSSYSII